MRYYIKQKVFSFRDKFRVTDENQNELYEVKGKIMSLSNKLELKDMNGSVLYQAKKKVFSLMANYSLYDDQGTEVALIKRKLSLRPNFDLSIMGKDLSVEGSFYGHAFDIVDQGNVIASINKKYLSWGDTYEIDILEKEHNVDSIIKSFKLHDKKMSIVGG
jgi:uncharacterized protein YxjI